MTSSLQSHKRAYIVFKGDMEVMRERKAAAIKSALNGRDTPRTRGEWSAVNRLHEEFSKHWDNMSVRHCNIGWNIDRRALILKTKCWCSSCYDGSTKEIRPPVEGVNHIAFSVPWAMLDELKLLESAIDDYFMHDPNDPSFEFD